MRNPIAFYRRIREALDYLDEGERYARDFQKRHESRERAARIASGVALCPVCQHGEIGLVFGAMDDRESI
jgi:hypothetical protein